MDVLRAVLVASIATLASCDSRRIMCDECYRPHEFKAICEVDYLAEDTCPDTLHISCVPGACRCHCLPGYFRREDYACEPERECLSRFRNPVWWLRDTDDIYLAQMSGYADGWTKFKCMKSKYRGIVDSEYQRNVEFYEPGRNNTWTYRRFNLRLEWRKMPGKEKEPELLTAHEIGEPLPEAIHSTYAILYSTVYCIILGAEYPPLHARTDCTCWTKLWNIGRLHEACHFVFNLFCKEPRAVLNNSAECWK